VNDYRDYPDCSVCGRKVFAAVVVAHPECAANRRPWDDDGLLELRQAALASVEMARALTSLLTLRETEPRKQTNGATDVDDDRDDVGIIR
jgi:hypothetical protein